MKSDFAVNKYLHTVASGWIFINVVGYIKNGSEEVVVEDVNWTHVRSNGRLWY